MRMFLVRFGDGDYKFIWNSHHIIADGRSRRQIVEEVFQVYDAMRRGMDVNLPDPRPYQDYIDWITRQDSSKSEEFWRTLLGEYQSPTQINLSNNDAYPVSQNREMGEIEKRIPESTTRLLSSLAQENNITLNTIIQGAWSLLLSRYSGEEEVVFGAVRAGRHWTKESPESLVGLFLYTVPMLVHVSPEKSFIEWLREIRQLQIDIREHEATPLVDIQGWSKVPRGMSLFNNILVFENYEIGTFFKSKGGTWTNREFYLIEDNGFPITLYAYSESGLLLKIHYDKNEFDEITIRRILGHLEKLLSGIIQDPKRSIFMLSILTDEERKQILIDWNDTGVNYPEDKLIHQIFETQAKKASDAVALIFEGESLTYGDLNQRANLLAGYLRSLGVGPEVLVGIAAERSPEMVIGLYGILKAGGAYVPLDPSYPSERLGQIIEDADFTVILTQEHLRDKLPEHKAHVVCLDSEWNELIAGQDIGNPVCNLSPDNLAYVIYTSGSTGKPKGVMNTHAGILNRLLWMQEAYNLTESDRVLQKTPFSFDVSVWEFFWPLMFGACLVIARPEGHRDSDYLVKTIIEQNVTTMHFVPSMLQIFLLAKDVEKCTSLRQVVCSGEALTIELQKRFFAKLDAELHNLYGPTEAAVDVTYWECRRESGLSTVPIGRPVANTQIYVLDDNMQPVPVGVSGELYIGGVQVARGYLNRPDLTAERFIPDPFSDKPDACLYKTGDSARFMPDGNVEYLGRLDFQVKIRGNRIELGEIEAVLLQHSDIREAVVLAREDIPGDQRLIAYIVPNREIENYNREIRNYLLQKLPEYMVPSHIVKLREFPLTSNQKIDRKALPVPECEKVETGTAYIPPKTELQKKITDIWQELLNNPRVGINDNFFELGGHSLLIVQAYYRLTQAVEGELSITDMFRFPTISALSDYILGSEKGNRDHSQDSTDRANARRMSIMRRRVVRQKNS